MWVWVGLLVVLSACVRYALARRIVAPWIMVDELIYSELAKSFAGTGHFLVRDESTGAYGFVYPALLSPAWALFHAVPHAYAAAKAINSVVDLARSDPGVSARASGSARGRTRSPPRCSRCRCRRCSSRGC